MSYQTVKSQNVPIKLWVDGVTVESDAYTQLKNVASMPFAFNHVAVMPDVHIGKGATIGSVIATKGAIIPAAVGVDIGCGMCAVRLSLKAGQLPDNLYSARREIEKMIPVGFDQHDAKRLNSREHRNTGRLLNGHYAQLATGLSNIVAKNPGISKMVRDADQKAMEQLGSLGGGNHFVELCTDENNDVWIMLHSGSRGIGNVIGRYFIEMAKKDMEGVVQNLPDKDLSYLTEGTSHFDDYCDAVDWAQDYAARNRKVMLELVIQALRTKLPEFSITEEAINCHHNYVNKEYHYGEDVLITRKGAVSANVGELGIIPGSMGAKSFIVRGLGNQESFNSCSHGAGRVMSRTAAKKALTVEDHVKATEGVECRKDKGVLDESPAAYKDIDAVMNAQKDLVEIVHTLKQVLCVKG